MNKTTDCNKNLIPSQEKRILGAGYTLHPKTGMQNPLRVSTAAKAPGNGGKKTATPQKMAYQHRKEGRFFG
jgi:hypothetical protein